MYEDRTLNCDAEFHEEYLIGYHYNYVQTIA